MDKHTTIAYIINPKLTLEQGCLVLDLSVVVKEGYLYNFNTPSNSLLVPQWRKLAAESVDKEAFAFLLKEELLFQQRLTGKTPHADSLLLQHIHIPPSQVLPTFELLSKTQKLFCSGKQLTIDFYGKTEFYYEGASLQNSQLEIKGHLKWRETDILITECQALIPGKPHHWFVRGLTLKMIQTSISWKNLHTLAHTSLVLEGGKKQTFLEELDLEDADTPRLIMTSGSLEEAIQPSSPFPLLVLKDRWGACADLWMDYGQGSLVPFHDPNLKVKETLGTKNFKRQLKAEENWEKDLLETDYLKKMVGTSHYYCPMDKVAKSLTFLLELGWKIRDGNNREVVKQTEFDLQLEDQKDSILIKARMIYEDYAADPSKVIGAFNRRENFIQLSSDKVGLLSLESTQALRDSTEEGEWISGTMKVNKNRFGSLAPLWDYAKNIPSLAHLKDKWESFRGIQEAPPSSDFCGNLRPYQQHGVNWLAFLHEYGFHGILADEMGLGKTVQVLAFLSRIPRGKPHLIVMPTSLLFNWRNEIHQFLPQWTCQIHQGPQRARTSEELHKIDIILTSYTTLRLDLSLLQSLTFSCLILDEAQMIKNAHTQTSQAVCQIPAQLRLSLTGTPVENHLGELWSQFHFLMPDLLGSQEQFDADVQAGQSDRRYFERIKRKISPFFLRRKKQDVASDLPERLDQVVWIEMSEEQRNVYERLLAGFKKGLLKKVELEGMGKHRLDVLEAILRLRQVCCHPLLVSHILDEKEDVASGKFEALLEDLGTIHEEGHKVLVYSQFTSMLQLMAKAARERGWNYGYLDGTTKNREEVVNQFQNDSTQCLFFISLKAGGVGLNLTAADYVYIYDPWWNEAVEEQAIQRAHRIGRKNVVIAKRFVVAESIEEKMMKLKATKRLMIDEIFEGESQSAPLTIEDLRELLS